MANALLLFGIGLAGPSSTAAWTPADLGASLALWLDAEDASTITLNGATVVQWDDKSGNGRHVTQPAAANQPSYETTGLNGKPTIKVPTEAQFLSLADANPTFGATDLSTAVPGDLFTVFSVGEGGDGTGAVQASAGRAGVLVGKGGGLANAGTFGLALATHDSNDTPLAPPRWVAQLSGYASQGVQNIPNWTPGALSTPAVVGVVWDGTVATATLNGAPFANSGAPYNSPNQNSAFRVGGMGQGATGISSTGGGNTKTSETIICDAPLSTADRQKLEGYLAWKWGGI
jgi:hypothetical protein